MERVGVAQTDNLVIVYVVPFNTVQLRFYRIHQAQALAANGIISINIRHAVQYNILVAEYGESCGDRYDDGGSVSAPPYLVCRAVDTTAGRL